jgi:hypothetical protein
MKSFIIRVPTDPWKELMQQQNELQTEIHERLVIPHQNSLVDYDADIERLCQSIDEDKKERCLGVLRDSATQFHEMHAVETHIIESLSIQILHIVAQEIINRNALQVTCEYKGHLFTIPIRYKKISV